MEAIRVQVERLNNMESIRKWNNVANEKQYSFTSEVKQIVVEDMRLVLVNYFGQK